MSYTKLLYHAVFCTKSRKNTIPETHEKELYAYIMGIIKNNKSKLYRIGGTENHLHLLFDMHPTAAFTCNLNDKETINRFCPYGQRFSAFARPQATLSLACGYEEEYLLQSEEFIKECLEDEEMDVLMDDLFFGNPPAKKDFKNILFEIQRNINKVRKIPLKQRTFDF